MLRGRGLAVKARSGFSVLLPTAGMEICRLSAVAYFLFLIPGSPPFPFAALACVLTIGVLAARGLSFVARRRITTIIIYGVLFGICAFILARFYYGLMFWPVACAAGFFFFRGIMLGARGVSLGLTLTRYDIGIGILFCVYFLRFGLGEADPLAMRIAGAYFLFSILALAASRLWERDEYFTTDRPAIGGIVSFIAVFFLAASALVFLYPLLSEAAVSVYAFLGDNSGPVLDFLAAVIRFFFGVRRKPRLDSAPSQDNGSVEALPTEPSEPNVMARLFLIIAGVLVAAALIVMIAVLVRALIRYLSAKKGPRGGEGLFAALGRLFRFLWNRLRGMMRAALRIPRRLVALFAKRRPAGFAEEAFSRLCAWGRVSGLPRSLSETPAEYARRLGLRFPAAAGAACVLAQGLEEELYGGRLLADKACVRLKAAARSLSSPALIPARLLCRLGRKSL